MKRCCDCRFQTAFCYCKWGFAVLHIVQKWCGYDAYKQIIGKRVFARTFNKNNDCVYYERKWYLFWREA